MVGWVIEARAGVPYRLEVALGLVQRAAEDCLALRQEVQMAEEAEDLRFVDVCSFVCARFGREPEMVLAFGHAACRVKIGLLGISSSAANN